MAREFELKYVATPALLQELRGRYPNFRPVTMETTYYDTPDGAMKTRRWTLRRRLENGKAVCSLKTPGDFIRRGEWETEMEDIGAAIPVLCKLGAPEELPSLTARGLAPVCAASFTRLASAVEVPGGTIELALDQGVFLGGGQEVPFWEIEVELKSGEEQAALDFAATLAAEYTLTPETKGKAERAMALCQAAADN